MSWPQFWHDWQGGAPDDEGLYGAEFSDWKKDYAAYSIITDKPKTEKPASLIYEEIGELWKPIAEDDDWFAFEAKLETFKRAVF